MTMVSDALYEYAVACRRQLHMYPEVGFDLPRTAAFITEELKKMGLEPTDRYGTCSVAAYVGPENAPFTVGLRADTDALPVQEKTGLPYASRIEGQMHACGHDTHTAILLATAKYLKERESELPCRVKLIFQPSEEGAVSGAKMMVDNGVMEDVDAIIGTHCENEMDVGRVSICPGYYMAACAPLTLTFRGKTSHATKPEQAVDAIAMAHEAYGRLKEMAAKAAGDKTYIWSVGTFHGGTVHNVISDLCTMDISFRFYDDELRDQVHAGIVEICDDIAKKFGGSYELDWKVSTVVLYNDPEVTAAFEKLVSEAGVAVEPMPVRKSSEDFAWMTNEKPGMIFRYGTRNLEKGTKGVAHTNIFTIDEDGMKDAIEAYLAFVMGSKTYFENKK